MLNAENRVHLKKKKNSKIFKIQIVIVIFLCIQVSTRKPCIGSVVLEIDKMVDLFKFYKIFIKILVIAHKNCSVHGNALELSARIHQFSGYSNAARCCILLHYLLSYSFCLDADTKMCHTILKKELRKQCNGRNV